MQGVKQELLELTELDGVGPSTARLLHTKRCTTIAHVAELQPSQLAEWLRNGMLRIVLQNVAAAGMTQVCLFLVHS